MYSALDKANAVADCFEDQFRAQRTSNDYLQHYSRVYRAVTKLSHSAINSGYKNLTISETQR